MYILTYLYILPEISFAIEMYGQPFCFSGYPYIESTTVLSDNREELCC